MKKDLITKQDRKFVEEVIKTGNKTDAAMKAYKSKTRNAAGVKAHSTLRKSKFKKIFQSIADQIPDKLLVEKHLELLRVPKLTRVTVKGDEIVSEESTDVQALKAGLDMAYKLKGSYAAEKKDITLFNLKELYDEATKDEN